MLRHLTEETMRVLAETTTTAKTTQDKKATTTSSMATATHGNAKALFGILFIQYCSYAFFYIMDHFHDRYPEHFFPLKR